jgi:exodeoxyribonuclease VII large subunit
MTFPDQNEVLYTLSEMQERYDRAIKQILYNKETSLKSLNQELQRNSVSRKISEVETQFLQVEDELKRLISYKLVQCESELLDLPKQLKDNFEYALQVKTQTLKSLEQKMRLYDPKLKQKEGWGEILVNGKRVELSTINEDDRFVISDTKIKLEVACIKKENL